MRRRTSRTRQSSSAPSRRSDSCSTLTPSFRRRTDSCCAPTRTSRALPSTSRGCGSGYPMLRRRCCCTPWPVWSTGVHPCCRACSMPWSGISTTFARTCWRCCCTPRRAWGWAAPAPGPRMSSPSTSKTAPGPRTSGSCPKSWPWSWGAGQFFWAARGRARTRKGPLCKIGQGSPSPWPWPTSTTPPRPLEEMFWHCRPSLRGPASRSRTSMSSTVAVGRSFSSTRPCIVWTSRSPSVRRR
mmetsp:Transcript_33289/g.84760  ORF Transcript_33289/g.84760 Transcript_33289/m.84760 type:complete len:241 (+) Transcript_33289:81-803(+)